MSFASSKALYPARTVMANGIPTNYIEAGSGDPLLLLHGGGAGADSYGNWFSCIPIFAQHYHVIAVDLLGFGATGKPDPATFAYSQDARNVHMTAFVEALGLGPVYLVGNSMGGATSIGVSIKRPDLVRKIVLMGSAGIKAESGPALASITNYDFTRDGMVRICQALANKTFHVDDEMVDYRVALAVEPQTRAAYSATMGWVKEQHGLYYEDDFIRKVTHKTLVVGGKEDIVVPFDKALRFLELIDNSWGYFLPHCGHWAMLEYPADFASETIRFLKG